MDEKEMTREQRLEIEEKAIQALIDMGVKFSVPLKIEPKQPPRYIRWWNRMFPGHVKVWRDKRIPKNWDVVKTEIPDTDLERMRESYIRNFYIKPLYLGTIDRIRQMYLNIEYDEEKIQDQPVQETKKLFKYTKLLSEIAATAVINDPSVAQVDSKEVRELSQFFMENLTVERLKRLSVIISQMMNSAGFTASIRLIRETGTTQPKAESLIEETED